MEGPGAESMKIEKGTVGVEGGEVHVPPTKVFRRLTGSVNSCQNHVALQQWAVKPCLAAAAIST